MMTQLGINFSEIILPFLAVTIGVYFKSPAFALAGMIIFSVLHLLCYAAINDKMPKVKFVPIFPIVQGICAAMFFLFFDNLPTSFVVLCIAVLGVTYLVIYDEGKKAAKKINESFNAQTIILLRIFMCLAGLLGASVALMDGMTAAAIALLVIAALPFPHICVFLERNGGDNAPTADRTENK